METGSAKSQFHIEGGDRLAFLDHIHWSAQPEITFYDTVGLPIAAFRHHRSQAAGKVEVIGDAPVELDWDVLFVSRNGSGMLGIEFDGRYREVALHREMCCLFPAGADNRLVFDGRAGSFTLYLRPGLIASLPESGATSTSLRPIVGQRMPRLAHVLGLIEAELLRPGLGSKLMVEGLLRAIACLLVDGEDAPQDADCQRIYLSPSKLKRVLDFVEAHLDAHIGLDDLAAAAGLSANHFLRVFKLATGETPYHYLRSRRIERARELLAHDSMPLAELALECGFANQAHFTAAFSREIGISPGRYRRSVKK